MSQDTHRDLQEVAQTLGIDITGLINQILVESLPAYKARVREIRADRERRWFEEMFSVMMSDEQRWAMIWLMTRRGVSPEELTTLTQSQIEALRLIIHQINEKTGSFQRAFEIMSEAGLGASEPQSPGQPKRVLEKPSQPNQEKPRGKKPSRKR